MNNDNLIKIAIKELYDGKITHETIEIDEELSGVEKQYIYDEYLRLVKLDTLEDGTENEYIIDDIRKANIPVLTWGSPGADKNFSPIEPHFFIILAGAQGSGKTQYTFHMATENAKTNPVLYISLEMTKSQIMTRTARAYAGITQEEWRDRTKISEMKKDQYFRKKEEMAKAENLFFNSPKDKSLESILNTILETGPALAIIDNLDLITKSQTMTQFEHEGYISKRIMEFTNEHNIPIILIHHLNKHGKVGDINSVRGSGKLSDDADMVLLGSREQGEELTVEQRSRFVIAVKKDRSFGYGGIHIFYFHKGKFYDVPQGEQQPGFIIK